MLAVTRTVVVGLLLAFLLFTPQGREIGIAAIAVGANELGFIPHGLPAPDLVDCDFPRTGAFKDFDPTKYGRTCKPKP